jgi:hypothetical protein
MSDRARQVLAFVIAIGMVIAVASSEEGGSGELFSWS